MRTIIKALPLAAVITISSSLVASIYAHDGATGIVKERMESMKSIASAIKTIAKTSKQGSEFKLDAVITAASVVVEHASKVSGQFLPDTYNPPSEALPIINERFEEFDALARKLEQSAKTLLESADGQAGFSSIKEPFAIMTSTCKSCHQQFRLKK